MSVHSHLKWLLQEENILQGLPLHPLSYVLQTRVGCSLRGNFVPSREQVLYKLSGTKGRVVSLSRGLSVDLHQVAPTSDLFATMFNNKLPHFVSPVLDPPWAGQSIDSAYLGFGIWWPCQTRSPLRLPNLLSQPFNQTPYRNLSNLNVHTWVLEPLLSRKKTSLRQWQHELRGLKERLNKIDL